MTYQVLRHGRLQKKTDDEAIATQAFEEECNAHPHQPVCLIQVDILKANPVQQEFINKQGNTQ